MRHVDFSPLYRSTVGFDRLFTMLDSLAQPDSGQTYPPYNIERTGEDAYRISMAVAGFSENDIAIEAHRNVLTVKGERKDETNGEGSEVLYRGIAARTFERRFQLADHVEVAGRRAEERPAPHRSEAHIPEELKPRKIEIAAGGEGQADRGQGRCLNSLQVSSRDESGAERRRFFLGNDFGRDEQPCQLVKKLCVPCARWRSASRASACT